MFFANILNNLAKFHLQRMLCRHCECNVDLFSKFPFDGSHQSENLFFCKTVGNNYFMFFVHSANVSERILEFKRQTNSTYDIVSIMNTFTSCVPCFFNQVEEAKSLFNLSDTQTREIMNILGDSLKEFTAGQSPPELAVVTQRELERILRTQDPYADVKKESNERALAIYPQMQKSVDESLDPLKKAIELSCAGNIIDYGVLGNTLDVQKEIERIVSATEGQINTENPALFAFDSFRGELEHAKTLLFIADNAGEIVFDRLLLQTIRKLYPKIAITVAVRGKPILNDALLEDALSINLDSIATVITSGVPTPGTVLSLTTEQFKEVFHSSDIVISKGQGNYESLSGERRAIFYLLTAKCHVIASDIGCNLKDLILLARNL